MDILYFIYLQFHNNFLIFERFKNIKMKYLFPITLVLITLIYSSSLHSQAIFKLDPDQTLIYLEEVYAGQIENLNLSDQEQLDQYISIITRIEIIEINEQISGDITLLSQVPIINIYNSNILPDFGENFDPITFNPFKYKMDFVRKDGIVKYKIDGTNYIIQILPL